MLTKEQSIQYFLFGCIPMRILLTLLPLYLSTSLLFYYGLVLFTIASSFLYLYFSNSRLNAFEAGGTTWWANFRLLHGLLYMGAAIYSLQGQSIAWLPLLLDTLLGVGLFLHKHFGYILI
jgi:hypothetical protein|uniref:Uncharacterized protein n=1 Tax=viral metagenome TaxID=1070528 RepID=A0A6C0IKQ6_9ZZZZ